jgi:hypothetical protein
VSACQSSTQRRVQRTVVTSSEQRTGRSEAVACHSTRDLRGKVCECAPIALESLLARLLGLARERLTGAVTTSVELPEGGRVRLAAGAT